MKRGLITLTIIVALGVGVWYFFLRQGAQFKSWFDELFSKSDSTGTSATPSTSRLAELIENIQNTSGATNAATPTAETGTDTTAKPAAISGNNGATSAGNAALAIASGGLNNYTQHGWNVGAGQTGADALESALTGGFSSLW